MVGVRHGAPHWWRYGCPPRCHLPTFRGLESREFRDVGEDLFMKLVAKWIVAGRASVDPQNARDRGDDRAVEWRQKFDHPQHHRRQLNRMAG